MNERIEVSSPGSTIGAAFNERRLFLATTTATLAVARFDRLDPHECAASVLIVGLQGSFHLRCGSDRGRDCNAAVVPAGVSHAIDANGRPLAFIWLEPIVTTAESLVGCLRKRSQPFDRATIGEAEPLRASLAALYVDREPALDAWLDDFVAWHALDPTPLRDSRVKRALNTLNGDCDRLLSAKEVALSLGLSSSRFQYLFSKEVGVPFRRYRAWARLRRALMMVVMGANFTVAAHSAGFADLAHFSNTYRRAFGIPASAPFRQIEMTVL